MEPRQIIDDRFEVYELIGQGGMGEVFRGVDLQTGQMVAIKSLRNEVVAQDPRMVTRFEREGETLRILKHPNIVQVIATINVARNHYIIMEYVPGGSLADLLARSPKLPLWQVRDIALELADALARAHDRRIIHRDIKPHNVLLAADGTPRLSDFGIAHIGDLSSLTQTGAMVGTYPYLSPEACNGQEPDQRTDIWAFGVLLFEMLAGRRPYEGHNATVLSAILHQPVPDILLFREDLPPHMNELMSRMLEKDPDRRIRHVRQVGAALEQMVFERPQPISNPAADPLHSSDPSDVLSTPKPLQPPAHADRIDMPTPAYTQPSGHAAEVGPTRIRATMIDQGLEVDRVPMSRSLDFDMIIESLGERYAVRVQAHDDRGEIELKTHSIDLPIDLKVLPRQRRDAAEWVKLARIPRRRANEELRYAREFGGDLFKHLFTGEVLAAFRTSRADLKPGDHLRIRLRVPEQLASLPWELLHDSEEDEFLLLANDLSLVRYPRVTRPIKPLRIDGPLQVLAVVASPKDTNYPTLRLDRELRRVEDALKVSRIHQQIELDVIRGPNTLLQLRERLRQPVHVLHILSHGDLDEEGREGVLIFEDADGAAEPVSAKMLRIHLQKQQGQIRLVLLNACLGALPVDNDPFSSLGAALLHGGVPAVIAMQFELADDAAAELSQVFYAELAAGAPVDIALREARLHLYTRYSSRLDWVVPVLFLRAEGGVLFEQRPAPPLPSLEQIEAAERHAEWEVAVGLLERYCQLSPHDAPFKARLDTARAELALDRAARAAIEQVEAADWEAATKQLDQIAAWRADYVHPQIDIQALRQRVQIATAMQQAVGQASQGAWEQVIQTLGPLANLGDPAVAVLLARAHQAQQEAESAFKRERQVEQENAEVDQLRVAFQRSNAPDRARAFERLETLALNPVPSPRAVELLSDLIEHPRLSLDQRLRAGSLAAELGDTRAGVVLLPPSMAPIAGGMLELARYPLSTSQFGCFVEAGGYDPQQPWWRGEGHAWLRAVGVAAPEYWNDEQFGHQRSNHPVVGVSWFEAEAFCLWLTHSKQYNPEGYIYRLPSADEWRAAAQGQEQRAYPWGAQMPSSERANYDKHIGETTPIGCYVLGATPEGDFLDLAGNIWEWTSTIQRPQQPDISRARAARNLSDSWSAIICGGSWQSQPGHLRTAHRHFYSPDYNSKSLGFRIARLVAAQGIQ